MEWFKCMSSLLHKIIGLENFNQYSASNIVSSVCILCEILNEKFHIEDASL